MSSLSTDALRERVDRAASWVRYDARTKENRHALPPSWVATTLASRAAWRFPHLEGVVESPTLTPSGELLERPGFDDETGLLYIPSGPFPPIPSKPSHDDARRAATLLIKPLLEFPFCEKKVDPAAAVAAILSLAARHAIPGCVPLFAIRSPAPGTGKGLLADVVNIIGTGRRSARALLPREDAELRKTITAIAIEGLSGVLIDNVDRGFGSSALAAAITAELWSDRLLGTNSTVRLPLRAVWFATGNGLTFRGDLGRRIIPIDLDAGVEHPEDRRFEVPDLLAWTREHRPALIVAALTVLRAYHVAGRPAHG